MGDVRMIATISIATAARVAAAGATFALAKTPAEVGTLGDRPTPGE